MISITAWIRLCNNSPNTYRICYRILRKIPEKRWTFGAKGDVARNKLPSSTVDQRKDRMCVWTKMAVNSNSFECVKMFEPFFVLCFEKLVKQTISFFVFWVPLQVSYEKMENKAKGKIYIWISKAAKRNKYECPLRINYLNISFLQKMLGNGTHVKPNNKTNCQIKKKLVGQKCLSKIAQTNEKI